MPGHSNNHPQTWSANPQRLREEHDLFTRLAVDPTVRTAIVERFMPLARQLARTSANPSEDALEAGHAWGEHLAAGGSADALSPAQSRRQVVQLLDNLGFEPQPDARAHAVRLRRCPLLEAAVEQPEVVCSVHLGIVRGALDTWGTTSDETSLVPFAEPGACLLHLTGATTRRTP